MSKIIATGSYLPSIEVTNTELIKNTKIDSSDEWITKRTGIEKRYFAKEEESVADIGTQAALNALEKVSPDIINKIKLIIVATMSANSPTPSVANQIQAHLNNTTAWGFDINGACSGFIMAMDVAERMMCAEETGYTLVIGTEKMSQILDFSDRGTSILFGDGAGAVLMKNDGQGLPNYRSQIEVQEDSKGSIVVKENNNRSNVMTMLGRDVFNFVNRTVIPSLGSFIESTEHEIDYLICHQANERLIDLMVKKLSIEREKVPMNIQEVANLSAGSIPVLIDELVRSNKLLLNGSQHITLCGFGGGLSFGHIEMTI